MVFSPKIEVQKIPQTKKKQNLPFIQVPNKETNDLATLAQSKYRGFYNKSISRTHKTQKKSY